MNEKLGKKNARKKEIRKLAYKFYLKRGKIDGYDRDDWERAEKKYRSYRIIWFVVSLLSFLAYLAATYFNKNLESVLILLLQWMENIFQNRLGILTIISILTGACFYNCAWRLVDEQTFSPTTTNPSSINEGQRDIHEARYNHLNTEITRYRDLVWKVTAFAWAIYYALMQFAEGLTIQTVSNSDLPKLLLPVGWLLIFCIIIALFATIFHAFCEIMAVRNQDRRRSLETAMGLLDPNWAHQETLEQPGRIGFRFSVIVFGILIWAPPLIILVLWASQR